mgnify:CR=1 FL=1
MKYSFVISTFLKIEISTYCHKTIFCKNRYKCLKNKLVLQKKIVPNSTYLPLGTKEARIRNDRQAVFQIVRELVHAQFERGDKELTKRLWQDVADREIDLDRVINLMYTCSFHEDDNEMTTVDETYQKTGLVG